MQNLILLIGFALAALVVIGAIALPFSDGTPHTGLQRAAAAVGLASEPDKLGWMDDAPLSASDIARIAAVKRMGSGSDGMHLLRGGLTRRDFELLRQDRRRARAAYPDVDPDKLTYGAWMPVNENAKVPSEWGGGNSHGTMGKDGKWYLDGGCYMSLVRDQFSARAEAETTKKFLADLKTRERQARLARLRSEGPFAAWGGTGGSMSTRLDKSSGMVVVTRAQEWASKGTKWTFPFVADEWADTNAGDLEAIKRLPSFAQATVEEIDVTPSGVSMSATTSTGRPFNGILMPGESITTSVPLALTPTNNTP